MCSHETTHTNTYITIYMPCIQYQRQIVFQCIIIFAKMYYTEKEVLLYPENSPWGKILQVYCATKSNDHNKFWSKNCVSLK